MKTESFCTFVWISVSVWCSMTGTYFVVVQLLNSVIRAQAMSPRVMPASMLEMLMPSLFWLLVLSVIILWIDKTPDSKRLHSLTDQSAQHGAQPVSPVPLATQLLVFELHAAGTTQHTENGKQQSNRDSTVEVLPPRLVCK